MRTYIVHICPTLQEKVKDLLLPVLDSCKQRRISKLETKNALEKKVGIDRNNRCYRISAIICLLFYSNVFTSLDISTMIQKYFAAFNVTILARDMQRGSQGLTLRIEEKSNRAQVVNVG